MIPILFALYYDHLDAHMTPSLWLISIWSPLWEWSSGSQYNPMYEFSIGPAYNPLYDWSLKSTNDHLCMIDPLDPRIWYPLKNWSLWFTYDPLWLCMSDPHMIFSVWEMLWIHKLSPLCEWSSVWGFPGTQWSPLCEWSLRYKNGPLIMIVSWNNIWFPFVWMVL